MDLNYYKYLKYKIKYLDTKNIQLGGGKKTIQFILLSDVMTGHNVWFINRNGNKIDFVFLYYPCLHIY